MGCCGYIRCGRHPVLRVPTVSGRREAVRFDREAVRRLRPAGTNRATHSTWWVCGKVSNARRPVEPVAAGEQRRGVPGQRGRVAGDVHDDGRTAGPRASRTPPAGAAARRVEHDRGDRPGPGRAARPARRRSATLRLRMAGQVVGGQRGGRSSDSTHDHRPAGPTASASTAANRPTPPYRSQAGAARPGRRPASASRTASASTSAAAGCTCQKPSAATAKSRPAACSVTPGSAARRPGPGRGDARRRRPGPARPRAARPRHRPAAAGRPASVAPPARAARGGRGADRRTHAARPARPPPR